MISLARNRVLHEKFDSQNYALWDYTPEMFWGTRAGGGSVFKLKVPRGGGVPGEGGGREGREGVHREFGGGGGLFFFGAEMPAKLHRSTHPNLHLNLLVLLCNAQRVLWCFACDVLALPIPFGP